MKGNKMKSNKKSLVCTQNISCENCKVPSGNRQH